MFDKTDIIITSSTYKKELLKSFNNTLKNIKIYTLSEFNRLFYYDYDTNANLYVMNKYHIIYDISDIYLKNLTYINNQTYKSLKLQFLSSLKQDLLDNKLLKINKLFQHSLTNKNITIYNLGTTKEIDLLIKDLSSSYVEIINNQEQKYTDHTINELNTIEDEVVFVATDICKKIEKGIDIKNIYLTNLSDDYYKLIKRIFTMYNIPVTLNDNNSIFGTYLVNRFLEIYDSDISKTLEDLKEYVDNEETEDIYNQILDIVNNYAFIDNYNDVLPLIKHDLKNTRIKKKDIINSVHEVSLDSSFTDNDYVYLLSFNQGVIPHIHKDEQYLSDKEREELNISLTVDKNNKEKEDIINILSNIKNLIITYKKRNGENEYQVSNINELLNYPIIDNIEIDYSYSNLYNKITLAHLKDDFNKYGTTNDTLYSLSATYKDLPYNTYDNKYKTIKVEDLKKKLNNSLSLSYSRIDTYFSCPFSFYLSNILKLDIYEDRFEARLGTLFHAVLEKRNSFKGNYDELWEQEIKNIETPFTTKEQVFLANLKDELALVIKALDEQETYTELHDELHEEQFRKDINGDMKIRFTGYIDKIKYKKEDKRTIIAVIDYKTGRVKIDLTTIPHGIGLQLPVYLYLAKNTDKLENVEVAGFYLQHILPDGLTKASDDEDYEEQMKDFFLLQGYSNSDEEILSKFDKNYTESKMIKGIKMTTKGAFDKRSKILSSEQIDRVAAIAEEKINEAAKEISSANFSISPIQIGDKNIGCQYCKFRDICFRTPDDVNEQKKYELKDVVGGEE